MHPFPLSPADGRAPVQLKEALGYAAYITCTTFLPNAVNVVTLFYGEV